MALTARVGPISGSFGGTVRLPGSKSLTNRALLMAALAEGTSRISNLLDCDDSRYMIGALRKLGVVVEIAGGSPAASLAASAAPAGPAAIVRGAGGPFPVKRGELFLGNAGTTTRFLTAALAASEGTYLVDGDERMRRRPIGDLVEALNDLGCDVRAPTGSPPVDIRPGRLAGGDIRMSGRLSSQFISAVLLAGPLARGRIRIRIQGELVSRPYIDLTIEGMRAFGASVSSRIDVMDGQPVFDVRPARGYSARDYFVEGDASAASYFYASAALTGATVRVEGVGRETAQGDIQCAEVLAAMGCRVTKEENAVIVTGGLLRGVDWDCSEIPDVVPTLATVALFARGRSRFRGAAHLRHKESDRIASVASELGKLGGTLRELRDGIEVEGTAGRERSPLAPAQIDPWGDHRIAMALSIASLALPGISIRRPQVVAKSFPGFFQALASLGAQVEFDLEDGTAVRLEPEGVDRGS
ncbi:MAG: 3-phosphoshikimate 1-carboxyvinyltransferase [Planctomycetes bacterium]|nr:3-phosphoshikimate 1-carboxyvinyltransferase [Planctomycetota bacterium]